MRLVFKNRVMPAAYLVANNVDVCVCAIEFYKCVCVSYVYALYVFVCEFLYTNNNVFLRNALMMKMYRSCNTAQPFLKSQPNRLYTYLCQNVLRVCNV